MSSSSFIPLCVPKLSGNEWAYTKECLDTGWVSSVGSFVDRFEAEFAKRVGAKAAVACSSGTAALHVAYLLAGVEPGDEVAVSTLTFVAPANAITYVGAHPVFIDAEPLHLQMDVSKLASFLDEGCVRDGTVLRNKKSGRKVSAVVPVHVVGHPCDLGPLIDVAARHGLPVVEDATESLGSTYKGRHTGTIGLLGCFSFNGNKIITTGNGGMIVTDDLALAKRAKYLTTQAKDDPVEFVHGAIGFNYRLANVSAAIGVAQLELLDQYIADKKRIANRYDQALRDLPGIGIPARAAWAVPNEWLYTIRVDAARAGVDSRGLLRMFRDAGIETRPLWQPMHRSPAHSGAQAWECVVADRLHAEALSIPCSVGLSTADQDKVIDVLRASLVKRG